MIGSITGDISGSVCESRPINTKRFPLFSPRCEFADDTVMTVAVAGEIHTRRPYLDTVRELGRRYYNGGYGGHFG